ncbi:MAG: adenylyl-sulfate kinase [Planctomycetes bacterium]|nr:adenylyl-sulfate kinase [Planctomycetota bacterium]
MVTSITETESQELLKIVIVGHVDHGKSTLIGRLLYDTGSLSQAKIDHVVASSKRRGMRTEWAFALDALQAERDQAITIDTAQVWFKTRKRPYCIIDAPGHREFLKNMVTGASNAEAALLMIDAEEGVQEQSRRHGYLLHLLGIRQIAVVVNKMDLVDYSQERFEEVRRDYDAYLEKLGILPQCYVPICAIEGEGIVEPSAKMPWYDGPRIVDVLDAFKPVATLENQPLRLPLQGVYKFDKRRLVAGRIEAGRLKVGDQVLFSPCNKISTVKSIENFPANDQKNATAGESVSVTLTEQVFVKRGDVMSHVGDAPFDTNVFDARVFWLGKRDLVVGQNYPIKIMTQEVQGRIERVHGLIDAETLERKDVETKVIRRNEVAEVTIRTQSPVALDSHHRIGPCGRFVIVDDYQVSGGGLADVERYLAERGEESRIKSSEIYWSESKVSRDQRERLNGHRGAVVWLTGLSGSGKSTIAQELDRVLFTRGYRSYILDGDNVRHGLNRDLGFSPEDRAENVRRVGEVGKLFAEAGLIVITAFISPYRAERDMARSLCSAGEFFEVHVACPLEVCEERDPKGLYQKARAGKIKEFTGISAPYEPPENPELVIESHKQDVSGCVEEILMSLDACGILGGR